MSAAILPLWLNVKPIWEIEKHMKVYRFEDPVTHEGVYQGHNFPARDYYRVAGIGESDAEDKAKHPIPYDDFSRHILSHVEPREVLFGFANIDQAKHWFDDRAGRHAMAEAGTVLDVYEVPATHVHKGGHQVMFDKGTERLTDTLNAETLGE